MQKPARVSQIYRQHFDETGDVQAAALLTLAEVIASEPPSDVPLTIAQAATRLNLPPRTIYQLCAAGKIMHQRHGTKRGTIRILPKALENYLKAA